MAENLVEQVDWISLADSRAAIARAREASVYRIGLTEVAHQLGEDPSTVSNQLKHAGNRRPSADLDDVCWLLDRAFREVKAGQTGELLLRRPDLTEGEALRLILAKAQANWDRRALSEVADIMARVKP